MNAILDLRSGGQLACSLHWFSRHEHIQRGKTRQSGVSSVTQVVTYGGITSIIFIGGLGQGSIEISSLGRAYYKVVGDIGTTGDELLRCR